HWAAICGQRGSRNDVGRRHSRKRKRDVVDRRGRRAGRFSEESDEQRLDYRATVSADAVWPRDSAGDRTSIRRRWPGIWIERDAMHHSQIKAEVRRLIAEGTVLPAHPLALDANRKLDTVHQ